MSLALPYDSDGGRDMGGAITALMCGEAYAQSARIAERLGPFAGYPRNREPMLDVIRMHRDSLRPIKAENVQPSLLRAAQDSWDQALALGEKFGYKNSQVTVLAPTGTIGFMMDCDTTGIEPDLALVKHKKLVGGGVIKIVNNTVPAGADEARLLARGTSQIVSYIDRKAKSKARPDSSPSTCRSSIARSADGRRPLDRLARPPEDDGGGAAVPFRRHQQDHQHARGIHGRRHHAGVHRVLEARAQGRGHLSRQLQGFAAAFRRRQEGRRKSCRGPGSRASRRSRGRPGRSPRGGAAGAFPAHIAASCPASASPSRTNSPSAATKATSPSACTRTASPAKSSSRWPRKAPRFPASWTASRCPFPSACSTACRCKALVDKFINTRFEPSGYTGHPAIPLRQVRARLHRALARRPSSSRRTISITTPRWANPK